MASMLSIKFTKNKHKHFTYRMLMLSALMLFVSLFFVIGCGGGGGSDSSIGVSPEEEEIRIVLDRLAASINATDTASVMSVFSSNIAYYKPTAKPWKEIGHGDVQKEMDNFFKKATQINLKFENTGTLLGIGDIASAKSLLVCKYIDKNGISQTFSEQIELILEKVGVWGITKFYKYDSKDGPTGSNFPPSL